MSLTLGRRAWSPDPQIYTRVILGLIIPGIVLTTALLALCGYAAWNPVSRRYLDRVSFRLLIYALIAHLFFGGLFTVGALTATPGWRCSLLSFTTNQSSLMFSAGMFFCIALNLPLVLAHNVNGQNMEKYYVIMTTLVCLICNLVPYASGNLGHVSSKGRGPVTLTRRQMGRRQRDVLTFWIMLFAVGEVCACLSIVGYLFAYVLNTRRFRMDTQTDSSEVSHRVASTIMMLRNIILRVGLYPVVSCLLNISAAAVDLHVSRNFTMKRFESAELEWRLNLADLAIYAVRPLIYGLLAATDPAFVRAIRALYRPEDESTTQSRPVPLGFLSTIIDLPPDETLSDYIGSQADKDDARGYISHVHAPKRAGQTSIVSGPDTDLEGRKEPPLEEGHDRSRLTMSATRSALSQTQQASIDLVYHI
ncbi:hypothetical protein MVEN_02229500 [Mycena venus]|uniref:Uncharacterized protein n=1 Tax=Mycena venus TaxID=2733690 RepID=A0A8H6X798_9AGAR|nr:hypothetical protein MVEN_02229500 [Mycena venus]